MQCFLILANVHNTLCLAFPSILPLLPFLSDRVILFCSLSKMPTFSPPFQTCTFVFSTIILLLCLGKIFMMFAFWPVREEKALMRESKVVTNAIIKAVEYSVLWNICIHQVICTYYFLVQNKPIMCSHTTDIKQTGK